MRGGELLEKMEYVDWELVEAAERGPARRKGAFSKAWGLAALGAAALCLCIAAGASFPWQTGLPWATRSPGQGRPILEWREDFAPEDYFLYQGSGSEGMSSGGQADQSVAVLPYSGTRYFSDERERLEAEGVIPVMEGHPIFACSVHYNEDGSIYSVEFSWHRDPSGSTLEDYSQLEITAGYQEVEQISCCVEVALDEDGNIVEPAVTVTKRDGIPIIAEGWENREKTMTFQNDSGWYQISGSWNDSYQEVVGLLDWIWEHPIDFSRFPMEAGDDYTMVPLEECPEAFADCLPDFAAYGFLEYETHVSLKNGEPVYFGGLYVAHVSPEQMEDLQFYEVEGHTAIDWYIEAEPDVYDLQDCIGTLEELTRKQVFAELEKGGMERGSQVSFLQGENVVTVYPDSAEEAWMLIQSLQESTLP